MQRYCTESTNTRLERILLLQQTYVLKEAKREFEQAKENLRTKFSADEAHSLGKLIERRGIEGSTLTTKYLGKY